MRKILTLTLPEDIGNALDEIAREEGLCPSDVLTEAAKEYLFFRRLRLLRDSLTSQAAAMGIRTDQDVFDRVS
jgi:predicted transcriptional regulator